MKDGFIKVAAAAVPLSVADVHYNAREIREVISLADTENINLLVFPELCLTGYSCGDLFYSDTLKKGALDALKELCAYTYGKYPVCVVGLPFQYGAKLYNCAAVLHGGKILGLVPKSVLPNYGEFYEKRQFTSGSELPENIEVTIGNKTVPFGTKLLFRHEELEDFCVGVELCEDLWADVPPSNSLCQSGATIIANPSASDEVIGKEGYRRMLVSATSARLLCGYVYSNAGPDESTQDMVFSRHNIVAENGVILKENKPFCDNTLTVSEIDVKKLIAERHRSTSFRPKFGKDYKTVLFSQPIVKTLLTRSFAKNPFVPDSSVERSERAEAILKIQAYGLKKRLAHAHAKTAVIGVSGGLDSTLALLVTAKAMDLLNRPRTDIVAVTMPCFGTTKRTKSNAQLLSEQLGVTLKEVDITAAVRQHFKDIGQDESSLDVTFENCQARERTQVLMDIANKTGGMVIGTGDLSELALGWATYNGDHMSMYAVNCSVPKTLVRYIVAFEADRSGEDLKNVLYDILDTPVSPELLPTDENGEIAQKTEDLVGPYELHDFFLYHMLRFGYSPQKLYRLCRAAYRDDYDPETILHWLKVFLRRFFMQQYKRSCIPDGPKVGSVTLSPRGDWRMPSDAAATLWLSEAENILPE